MRKIFITIFALLFMLCLTSCIGEHVHSFSSEWSSDLTEHWHECECGEKNEVTEHRWDGGTVTTESQCTTNGEKTFSCEICGQSKTSVVTATGHKYSSEYQSDDTHHWNSCSCGEKSNLVEHLWDSGEVITEATETSTGLKRYKCTTCEQTKDIIIPVLDPEMSGDDPYGDDIY